MLSILTVNIGAASRERAEVMLRWLAGRPESVFVLTETSAGDGTAYLLDRFRRAGYAVVHTPDANGDRGTAIVSRVRVAAPLTASFAGVTIPGRVAAVVLDTEPAIAVLGVYVPSRDRSANKTEKKQRFVASLLQALDELPAELRDHVVLGGDYNVIPRTHRPLHPGFLPFEFGMLETLELHGRSTRTSNARRASRCTRGSGAPATATATTTPMSAAIWPTASPAVATCTRPASNG